jgi:hypothetical protein
MRVIAIDPTSEIAKVDYSYSPTAAQGLTLPAADGSVD